MQGALQSITPDAGLVAAVAGRDDTGGVEASGEITAPRCHGVSAAVARRFSALASLRKNRKTLVVSFVLLGIGRGRCMAWSEGRAGSRH